MYKAIIIDDELMARELLQGMLAEYCPQISLVDLCENLSSGVKSISKHKPDLVFLDIEMPGYSGLDLLDFINDDEINFSIIFVTAYNHYAIRAFKLSAVDYLLKPLEKDDLILAVSLFEKHDKAINNYHILKKNLYQGAKKIALSTATSIQFVNLIEILFFKANGSYTNVFLKDGRNILTSKNLKYFEDILQHDELFYRTHKSFIVNIEQISEYVRSDGGYLLIDKHQVNISNEKLPVIIDLMKR
jgi:two-component system LytT family response regulator